MHLKILLNISEYRGKCMKNAQTLLSFLIYSKLLSKYIIYIGTTNLGTIHLTFRMTFRQKQLSLPRKVERTLLHLR